MSAILSYALLLERVAPDFVWRTRRVFAPPAFFEAGFVAVCA